MSLNAGAGAGSSCPDVAVERRLRVPTLFWSTVQKRSRSSGSCACACRRVPPGGAPGSFIRSARIIRTHGGYIQHSTYNRDTRPLREVASGSRAPRDRPTPSGRLYGPMAEAAHTGRAVRGGRRPVGRRAGARRLGPRGGPVLPGQCSGAAEHPRRPSS